MPPGAGKVIGRCNLLRIPVVLVTNQSGIGRGYYDWGGFQAVQAGLFAVVLSAARSSSVAASGWRGRGCWIE